MKINVNEIKKIKNYNAKGEIEKLCNRIKDKKRLILKRKEFLRKIDFTQAEFEVKLGDLGFAKEDRAENVRRVSEVAKLMMDAGLIVIVALVSPFRVDRDQARELFAKGKFIEVWVNTPAELCAQRDPKGLYKKAAAGDLPNMTGIGQEYEAPLSAEVKLDGTLELKVNTEIILEIAK